MFRYLIRRILWAMFLFLVITFVTFVIFFMAPNDPARAMCGGDQASPACLKTATEKLGLDKPVSSPVRTVPQSARRPTTTWARPTRRARASTRRSRRRHP